MRAGEKATKSGKAAFRAKLEEPVSNSGQLLESLYQSEKLFRLIFERADIGIAITDRQGNFLDVNPAMARLLGYSRAEMRKMKFVDITHPDDRAGSLRQFNELMAGKIEGYRLEKRYLHRDGRVIWVRLIVSSERSPEGPPLFSIGMIEDITEEKTAVEALKESEERYRLLAENISDVIWTRDLDGKIKYISPSIEALTDYSVGETVGMSLEQFLAPASAESAKKKTAEQLTLDSSKLKDLSRSWTMEVELRRKDGSTIGVESKMTFLRDSQGHPYGILGVTRDLSLRKQLEKELIQAQKMEAVSRLAGGVAHDFNNLLMAMMGYCDLILSKLNKDDPLLVYAQNILNAAEQATSLTRQLMAFSRRELTQPQIINLTRLIADLEKMLRRLLRENLELEVALDQDLDNIKADYGQVEQIILNLVVNAQDAQPGKGKIRIETENIFLDKSFAQHHPGLSSGFYVRLRVADNGCGMDAETLEHIFEPFFTTKERNKGTGLGLSTVYGIVKQCSGHIDVRSEVGKGSAFGIYFPRVLDAESVKKQIERVTALSKGWETILVAEDEDTLREVIGESLRLAGYQVLMARNAGEALLISQQHQGPIHLLLADILMPLMGGIELASLLTKDRPDMKLLFMSGHTESAIMLDASVSFIRKPCRTVDLIKRIRQELEPAT